MLILVHLLLLGELLVWRRVWLIKQHVVIWLNFIVIHDELVIGKGSILSVRYNFVAIHHLIVLKIVIIYVLLLVTDEIFFALVKLLQILFMLQMLVERNEILSDLADHIDLLNKNFVESTHILLNVTCWLFNFLE